MGSVAPAMLAVQLADPLLADELDRQVALLDPGRAERRGDGVAKLLGDVGEVERQPGFWRSEYAP